VTVANRARRPARTAVLAAVLILALGAPMTLPAFAPRYVPAGLDASSWEAVAPLLDELERRALPDAAILERWLEDWSETQCAVGEAGERLYVAMTCRTDDAAVEKRYLAYMTDFLPKVKPRWQALKTKYLAHPDRPALPADRFGQFDRHTANEAEIFRRENVAPEAKETELSQQYQKLCGAMTVVFDGAERPLPYLGKVQEETDRARREQAFRLTAERRLRDREAIDALFDALVQVRTRIARTAGFADYRDYAFRLKGRFDYTPADCAAFAAAVERRAVPLLRARQERRRLLLGVDRLRPWDLAVDPRGRPPLRPFETVDQLVAGCGRVFRALDPVLGEQFESIRARSYLDLDARKGKAPGGYQATFELERMPFIFMNATGTQGDVETLLHEGGHAFHTLHARGHALAFNRSAPLEFCEVASMGMELLGGDHLGDFLDADAVRRARARHLEDIVGLFAWIATIDQFQHDVYTRPDQTRAEREALWLDLKKRFGGIEDWTGHENALAAQWHRQAHLFAHPFYYIEYGIAQIGALQVWQGARKDPAQALARYRAALALGGTRPLPALFEAAGARFRFDDEVLGPLVDAVAKELED
jgi:oligoendopeptidase F